MPHVPRILIVDDDPIIAHLVTTMLQTKGYGIAGIVETGEEAVIKAAELAPDLVIMDVGLAGSLDGMDAATYIFQFFHHPILFITGITEEEKLDRLKYSRPYGIVFKPFTMIEITTMVDLAIYNHANRPAAGEECYPAGDPKVMMEMLEAVYLTDRRGRIIFFNTYAAWFADIPARQIMMKHWRDVLMFVDDQTGEEVKDPVAEAVRNMTGTILESRTSVVTTTSKSRKARVAVRPVKDDHGRFLAVMISIKEKTA